LCYYLPSNDDSLIVSSVYCSVVDMTIVSVGVCPVAISLVRVLGHVTPAAFRDVAMTSLDRGNGGNYAVNGERQNNIT